MPNTIPTLTTARLVKRAFQPDDINHLYEIYQHEGVLKYFPNPKPPSRDQVQRFIDWEQEHWMTHGCGNWAVVQQADAGMIGWAGLQYLPELEETEVGFLLDKPYWGMGYATEAALASLQFGFNLGLRRIVALVHPQNLASQRVLQKCRLQYDRTLPLWGLELMHYHILREPEAHQ